MAKSIHGFTPITDLEIANIDTPCQTTHSTRLYARGDERFRLTLRSDSAKQNARPGIIERWDGNQWHVVVDLPTQARQTDKVSNHLPLTRRNEVRAAHEADEREMLRRTALVLPASKEG